MSTWHVLTWLLAALTVVGILYHAISLFAAVRFARTRVPEGAELPAVSLLKPVRGVDPDAYENYASFCRQEYPEYEILFGVQDPQDPAVELIRRLQRDFPGANVRLIVSDERIGYNLKVCNVQNLLLQARHHLLVISDSDMRVRPDYLRQIASHFKDPRVGLVTSPYCGVGMHSVAAGLEALGMATDFFPGVAVASQLASPAFGLGSTLAFPRSVLAEIGGFEKLGDYLADDFQLGFRVAKSGRRVVLSRYVVDTVLPNSGFRQMFARRLRWMRTARACQPAGFAGSFITHSTVWALLLAVMGRFHGGALALLGVQQLVRWTVGLVIGCGVLKSEGLAAWFWLLPASDVLNFSLWLGSWCGNTVLWRGDRYRLTGGGRMVRIGSDGFSASGLVGDAPRS